MYSCICIYIFFFQHPWDINTLGSAPGDRSLFSGWMAHCRLVDFIAEDYVFVHKSVEKDFLDQLKLKRRLGMGIGMGDVKPWDCICR